MENQTDSAIMKHIQAGDPSHLAVLFERYHLALFRYLLQMTRNRTLSEDLVQEVFFRVLKYAQGYDPISHLRRGCMQWPGTHHSMRYIRDGQTEQGGDGRHAESGTDSRRDDES